MPGYSGTPLAKKLGIKAGFRVFFVNIPDEVCGELRAALTDCTVESQTKSTNKKPTEVLDFAMVFTKSAAELEREFARISRLLAPAGMLWISWPKKSSGVATDLSEDSVREIGLRAGLVDVKVCAVTDVWSGLKFVRRLKDRK
jgi:hypothetical protein